MHQLGAVIILFGSANASIRPLAARDAALQAQIDTLLFRYEQPSEQSWGVDFARGFKFDLCEIGGRFDGWGREVRALMPRQGIRPSRQPIPRFVERNAVWSEDLSRVRLNNRLYPISIVTPYGDWIESPALLSGFGKTARERKARTAWLKRIRRVMRAFPHCLVVGVDYHC